MVLLGELPVVLYYSEGLKESARKMFVLSVWESKLDIFLDI